MKLFQEAEWRHYHLDCYVHANVEAAHNSLTKLFISFYKTMNQSLPTSKIRYAAA